MQAANTAAATTADRHTGIDAVVGHHTNPFRSGVARFNEMLAESLGVPVLRIGDAVVSAARAPLLSFKVAELDPGAEAALTTLLDEASWSAFLHDYRDLPLERRVVTGATRVWCGNHAVHAALQGITPHAVAAWAPGLVADLRRFEPAAIQVFSFGMAHKIRTDMFRRLKRLLDATGDSYALYVSNANHETSTLEDAQLVYDDMHEIFPRSLYFVGNLSDVTVYNGLLRITFFAAFFPGGVRANNTSVASAMEHGAVVITNLDEHSPPDLVHMDNVIDINQAESLPSDPLVLRRLSVAAMETARRYDWEALARVLRGKGD